MARAARVEGTNLAGLQALAKRIEKGESAVFVGVPASAEPEKDGTAVAEVAWANEFGTSDGRIPERSFLRSGIRENVRAFIELNKRNLLALVRGSGMTEDRALGQLGAAAANAVQRKIAAGPFVPNAESTIKRKGSSKPLVDSGNLRQSVTWSLEGDGAPAESIPGGAVE